MKTNKPIIDVCCGSRMFWFDKKDDRAMLMDKRKFEDTLCDGRKLRVSPDVVGDFRNMPFDDNTFSLVVFDPPHLFKLGESSWFAKKYGKLTSTWRADLRAGFAECFRVLRPHGTLVFKWCEEQIKLSEILVLTNEKPLFGHRAGKTHFVVFMKPTRRAAEP